MDLKHILLIVLTLSCFVDSKKEKEVTEDFSLKIEHSTSSVSPEFSRRGEISFITKASSKNGKQSFNVINQELSKDEVNMIKQECELNGKYRIRITNDTKEYVNSVPAVSNKN